MVFAVAAKLSKILDCYHLRIVTGCCLSMCCLTLPCSQRGPHRPRRWIGMTSEAKIPPSATGASIPAVSSKSQPFGTRRGNFREGDPKQFRSEFLPCWTPYGGTKTQGLCIDRGDCTILLDTHWISAR